MKEIMLLFAILIVCTVVKAEDDSARIAVSADIGLDPDISYFTISSITTSPEPIIRFHIYRGKTLKRTLYVHIEDASGNRISTQDKFSLPTRFQHYSFTSTLSLTKACSPPHYLVIEGLDLDNRTLIDIECSGTDDSQSSHKEASVIGSDSKDDQTDSKDGSFSFDIVDLPEEVLSGVPFSAKFLVENPTSQFFDIEAWSYVYRSSKCYSGDREANKKTISIPEYSNVTFYLENTVDALPGEYSYKLKLLLPGHKLPKELTGSVTISPSVENRSMVIARKPQAGIAAGVAAMDKDIISSKKVSGSEGSAFPKDGSLAYLSSSAKAKRMIPIFVITVLAALLIFLVVRNL